MKKFTFMLKPLALIVMLIWSLFASAQTSEVIVSVNWPQWSGENKVEVYNPSGTLIQTIDDDYDGGNGSYNPGPINLGCLTDNLNSPSGTGYYVIIYERYGDGWNSGGTLDITSGGSNVLNYNENTASNANDLDNGNNGEETQTIYFSVTNGGAACAPSGPEINVTGLSNTILDNDTTPNPADGTNFGNVYIVSGSVTRTFTIENLGGSTLNIGGFFSPYITISDAVNFSISSAPSNTISGGSSTTFDITFDPVTAGAKTATITINNNDTTGGENPYNFNITGVGTTTAIVSPGNVNSDLQLWMKADAGTNTTSNNGDVSSWDDNSSNNFTAVNGDVNKFPTYQENIINFNPAIKFNDSRSNKKYFKIPTADVSGTGLDITPSPASATVAKRSSMSIFAAFLTDGSGAGTMFSRATSGSRSYQLWLGDRDRVVHYTLGRTDGTSQSDPNSGINFGITHARNDPKISSLTVDINTTLANDPNTNNILRYVNGYLDPLTTSTDGDAGFGTGETTNMDVLIGARRNSNNNNTGNELIGNVAEIIVYDRALSATERQKVETYMAIKYGITLGYNDEFYRYNTSPSEITTFGYSGTSNDYLLSDGSFAWDGSANSGYGYNVFGVARDDNSGLLQLKSKSVHIEEFTGTYVDGTTASPRYVSILTMEDESATITNDRSYLLVGNNGARVQLQSASVPERTARTINRIWKSREGTDDVGTVKLDFDLSQYSISNATELELIVSKNSNLRNYKNYAGTYNPSTRTVTFTDINLEDGDYFTLAILEELQDAYHFDFNGTSKYVDLGDNFDLTGDFTISAWIKRDAGSNNKSIISKRNSADTQGYDFKISGSGNLEMYWYNGIKQTLTSSTFIPLGKWHHVAAIYNSNRLTLYLDGVEVGTDTKLSPIATSHKAIIGAVGSTPSNFYDGDMDELRVFDTALTENQLRYLINQEIEVVSGIVTGSYFRGRGITPTKNEVSTLPWATLKAYFPFSHVRGNCLFNKSSFTTNNGRLFNTTNASIENQTAPLPYKSVTNGNWNNTSTWLNGTVQNIPGHVSVKDNTTLVGWNIVEIDHNITMDNNSLPAVNGHNNRSVLALFVDANKLTVDGGTNIGHGLTVTHYLNLDGQIDLEGESQLIQTEDSDLEVASFGTLEKDQQGVKDLYTYNYWSSPVGNTGISSNNNNYIVSNIFKDGTNASSPQNINFITSGYDGTSGSPIGIADYWIWKFANQADDDYSAWQHVRRNGTIRAGEGFTMKGVSNAAGALSQEQNYVLRGKPNNGDIQLPINNGNDYLVGNPYPSAIDANEFISDNLRTSGTLYFWEHWGGGSHNLAEYQGGYGLYNLSGGVPAPAPDPDVAQVGVGTKTPGQYIPISQGFFVIGTGNGTITFENDQRAFVKEGTSSSVFMRNANITDVTSIDNDTIDDRMKFRIGFESSNALQLHRQLLLTIDDNTTLDVDWAYDAILYDDQTDDMFWMINDKKYIIQGSNEANIYSKYPLGIKVNEDGINTITIDSLENVPDDINIYVHDIDLDLYHDLRAGDYDIFLTAGEHTDRFEITFGLPTNLSIDENTLKAISINYTNAIESIVISNPMLHTITKVEMFNIAGQLIYTSQDVQNEPKIYIELKDLSVGTYIIKLQSDDNKLLTQKVLIK